LHVLPAREIIVIFCGPAAQGSLDLKQETRNSNCNILNGIILFAGYASYNVLLIIQSYLEYPVTTIVSMEYDVRYVLFFLYQYKG
jgi:hypothetical protein